MDSFFHMMVMINGDESIKEGEEWGKKKQNALTVKIVHSGTFVEKIKFLDILPFQKQKECLIDKIEISEMVNYKTKKVL